MLTSAVQCCFNDVINSPDDQDEWRSSDPMVVGHKEVCWPECKITCSGILYYFKCIFFLAISSSESCVDGECILGLYQSMQTPEDWSLTSPRTASSARAAGNWPDFGRNWSETDAWHQQHNSDGVFQHSGPYRWISSQARKPSEPFLKIHYNLLRLFKSEPAQQMFRHKLATRRFLPASIGVFKKKKKKSCLRFW